MEKEPSRGGKPLKVVRIKDALRRLERLSDEIRYKSCIEEGAFTMGLISFSPVKGRGRKLVCHRDKDVVCHVVEGKGRLRARGKTIALRPGMVCHVPRGTPHDFAAGREGPLVLFYSLIETG